MKFLFSVRVCLSVCLSVCVDWKRKGGMEECGWPANCCPKHAILTSSRPGKFSPLFLSRRHYVYARTYVRTYGVVQLVYSKTFFYLCTSACKYEINEALAANNSRICPICRENKKIHFSTVLKFLKLKDGYRKCASIDYLLLSAICLDNDNKSST